MPKNFENLREQMSVERQERNEEAADKLLRIDFLIIFDEDAGHLVEESVVGLLKSAGLHFEWAVVDCNDIIVKDGNEDLMNDIDSHFGVEQVIKLVQGETDEGND